MGRSSLIMPLMVSQALGLAVFAWAASDTRESTSAIRMQIRQDLRAKFRGTLSCEMLENSGCSLAVIESSTGKRYELKNSGYAMRLYENGTRDVLVDGEIRGRHVYIHDIKSL